MRYQNYNTFSFIQDEDFVAWVKMPSKESDQFWKDWIENNPEKKTDLEKAIKIIQAFNYDENGFSKDESEKILSGILHEVSSKTKLSSRRNESKVRKLWSNKRYYGIAAAFLLLLVATYQFLSLGNKGGDELLVVADEYITKENPIGVKSKITLSDQTVVYLNANSRLYFPKHFAEDKRDLRLEGEAYFEVAEDASRPFSVDVNGIKVTALGTSFNIKTEKDSSTEVALLTGKVKVENKANGIQGQLLPNEKYLMFQEDTTFYKEEFNPEDVIAWTKNIIVFEEADFQEIINVLTNWYGVEFEIKKQPKEVKNYSGRFQGKSLDQVLEILSYSSGFKYQITGKKVIIE